MSVNWIIRLLLSLLCRHKVILLSGGHCIWQTKSNVIFKFKFSFLYYGIRISFLTEMLKPDLRLKSAMQIIIHRMKWVEHFTFKYHFLNEGQHILVYYELFFKPVVLTWGIPVVYLKNTKGYVHGRPQGRPRGGTCPPPLAGQNSTGSPRYMRSFYLRIRVYAMAYFSGTYPLIYSDRWSFYMREYFYFSRI